MIGMNVQNVNNNNLWLTSKITFEFPVHNRCINSSKTRGQSLGPGDLDPFYKWQLKHMFFMLNAPYKCFSKLILPDETCHVMSLEFQICKIQFMKRLAKQASSRKSTFQELLWRGFFSVYLRPLSVYVTAHFHWGNKWNISNFLITFCDKEPSPWTALTYIWDKIISNTYVHRNGGIQAWPRTVQEGCQSQDMHSMQSELWFILCVGHF